MKLVSHDQQPNHARSATARLPPSSYLPKRSGAVHLIDFLPPAIVWLHLYPFACGIRHVRNPSCANNGCGFCSWFASKKCTEGERKSAEYVKAIISVRQRLFLVTGISARQRGEIRGFATQHYWLTFGNLDVFGAPQASSSGRHGPGIYAVECGSAVSCVSWS